MTKEEYTAKIRQILDMAAGDVKLTTEDYIDLCEEIEDDVASRAEASQEDLDSKFDRER